MAFIIVNQQVVAFAEYADVQNVDQRIWEANEGISDVTMIEDLTIKATNRILELIRTTTWWRHYYLSEASTAQQSATQTQSTPDVPRPNAALIRRRQDDFTDLCVYYTMYEYLLPKIADYSAQDNAEVRKIGVYRTKFEQLFKELIEDGSWYDFDADGTVTSKEKMPTKLNLVRVR